ncbi:MAG: POTRA domain-containing protein [Candidatus Acidiferrales bacterium]
MRILWNTSPLPRCLAPLTLVLSALALNFLAAPRAGAQETALEGRRVAEIRVVDESGKAAGEHTPALPLEVGEPFDFAAERETLRTLYGTGDYADIRVTATPQADGVRVDFIVRRNFFNNVIRIEGLKEPPTEPAALAAIRMGLGEPFRESALREGIPRLQQALHDDGLYLAKVTWDVVPHESTRQMDITLHVDPGMRARVGDLILKNHTSYSDQELIRRSKISGKNELTAGRVTRGAQRLKKFLVNQGYLGASAVITPGTYDPISNRVPLTYDVTAGPRVRIEIGGAHISKSRERKLLPIYAEGAVDEDLLQEGRRNVRDFFQREGYFNADVQVSSHDDAQSGERVLSYEISRGDRFRLASVSFDGNKYFSRKLLSNRLQLLPASFASSGRFSQRLVRDDGDSIRALYFSNGFRDAQVTSAVDDNYQGKKGNLFVSFHIVEGPQTRVESLEVQGNQALSSNTLLAVVGSTAGQPYSDSNIASDRNNILAMYYNEGFPQAHFQEEVLPAGNSDQLRLIYHIFEGPRIEVAKVLLTGYQYTRPGIIAREVQIKPNGPLREGDVVESQRRLYNLGVFSRVQIAPQNPNGTDPDKTMVVVTQEGGRYTIGYGFGFEVQRLAGGSENPNGTTVAASPRGIFEISRSDMFGRAQTLTLKVRASTLQYRALVSYTADNFLAKRKFSLQFTGFADKTQDVNTFTSTRYEGAIQLIQTLSPSSSLLYRYFFRRVEAAQLRINPNEIPLLSQPTLVSGFGVTYARDRRDNPGDPKRGTFNTADVSIASRSLGSSASFFRGYVQNSSFTPFGRAFVFARSTRFGIEETLGSTEELDVPLPERFFAGGGTSIRGFGLNQAGPRDPVTGFPIGGLALLAFNQELRFPMRLPFVGNRLGGTLFYDAGNVYRDVSHISFSWKPHSFSDLNYFSHTVGFGVRYPTPVGPLRLDLGYQLNPPRYQAEIGPSPIAQFPRLIQLPHLQFFFNIGPIF